MSGNMRSCSMNTVCLKCHILSLEFGVKGWSFMSNLLHTQYYSFHPPRLSTPGPPSPTPHPLVSLLLFSPSSSVVSLPLIYLGRRLNPLFDVAFSFVGGEERGAGMERWGRWWGSGVHLRMGEIRQRWLGVRVLEQQACQCLWTVINWREVRLFYFIFHFGVSGVRDQFQHGGQILNCKYWHVVSWRFPLLWGLNRFPVEV